MFGIGMPEMILILAVALIVIGPKKLPDLARSLGRALGEFKKATRELKDSIDIDDELESVRSSFDTLRPDVAVMADRTPLAEDSTSEGVADSVSPTEDAGKVLSKEAETLSPIAPDTPTPPSAIDTRSSDSKDNGTPDRNGSAGSIKDA